MVLGALRAYTHTSLRGRTRITRWLHAILCPPNGGPFVVTVWLGGEVPFHLDLTKPYQQEMYYGFMEPNEIAFLKRLLQPRDVFIDVGAHIGFYSAVALSRVGLLGEVHAFEPVPDNFEHLLAWAEEVNALGYQVVAQQKALGATRCVIEGRTQRDWRGWSILAPDRVEEGAAELEFRVEVIRFDEYWTSRAPEDITCVKIDVEGAEVLVLQGMEGLFTAGARPVIMCEIRPHNIEPVAEILLPLGYRAFRCVERGRLLPFDIASPVACYLVVWLPRRRYHA